MALKDQSTTQIDKSAWGEGPWQGEPDHKEWRDAETGLPCIAHRQPSLGHWCGYVAVPPGHPAHGKDYDDVNATAHGGLTYADKCEGDICHVPEPGEPDNVWWLGFDCGHLGDMSPAKSARDRAHGWAPFGPETYRTLPYIEAECAELAKQLAAMS